MPIYDYLCADCGMKENVWAGMHEMERACDCGQIMHRIASPTRLILDIEPYLDTEMDAVPQPVKSRQHKNQLLAERGLVIK
jgi:putative FmdB family regulatory protein